jgi:hypothetical protein
VGIGVSEVLSLLLMVGKEVEDDAIVGDEGEIR